MTTVKRTLAVDLGGLRLTTPVMIASGCGGAGRELSGLVDLHKIGGIVTRTITVAPRKGSPTPRVAESASGIVWDTGLQNPGLDAFVAEELPRMAKMGVPVIVSVGGGTLEEYVRLTSALQGRPEVAAIEVHLSMRDQELDREILGAHPDRVSEIVGAVSRMSTVPVFAKLPGGAGAVVDLAHAAVRAGATGLVLTASPPAMGVDADRLRPGLGGVRGWLSGPALKPLTLRALLDVSLSVPDVPLIASGGVRNGKDAVECLLAGASAVQVGTAVMVDPAGPVTVAQGVARYLKGKGLSSPADLRGRLMLPQPAAGKEGP